MIRVTRIESSKATIMYDNLGWPNPFPPYVREDSKIGRNDPCLCGSGKKYKRCSYLLQ